MDPLSIAATCVGLVSTITKASLSVATFVRDVRDATHDMDAVSRELLGLKAVLETLAHDVTSTGRETYPPSLAAQIPDILTNCQDVMTHLDQTLKRYAGRSAQWSWSGKQDGDQLRFSLESYKSVLSLTVELSALNTTREVKADTGEIRLDTAAIMMDTSEILSFIRSLQTEKGLCRNHDSYILQRYLDELTSCAETVYQESVVDTEEDQGLVYTKIDPDAAITSNLYDIPPRPHVSEPSLQQSKFVQAPGVLLPEPATNERSFRRLESPEPLPMKSPRERHDGSRALHFARSQPSLVSHSANPKHLETNEQYSSKALSVGLIPKRIVEETPWDWWASPKDSKDDRAKSSIANSWPLTETEDATHGMIPLEQGDNEKDQMRQPSQIHHIRAPHRSEGQNLNDSGINRPLPDSDVTLSTSSDHPRYVRWGPDHSQNQLQPRYSDPTSFTFSEVSPASLKEIKRPTSPRKLPINTGDRSSSLVNHEKASAAQRRRGQLSQEQCKILDKQLVQMFDNGTVKEFEHLLERGADPNLDLGRIGLRDRIDCISLVLEYGADPTRYIFQAIHKHHRSFALQLTEFLIKAGADVNHIQEASGSPLHSALDRKVPDIEMIRLLIKNGASTTQRAPCYFIAKKEKRTLLSRTEFSTRYVTPSEIVSKSLYAKHVDRAQLLAILKGEE